MATATVRIPAEKKDALKIIAGIEKTHIGQILSELIDEYIERRQETLELLSRPEWVDAIMKAKQEVEDGAKGTQLVKLED